MNYPIWRIPAPGLLIAAVAIIHVFISHFAIGGGLFLVLTERKARRDGDHGLLGFVRSLSKAFTVITLVLGALTGVAIWFTIGLVQPQATSALIQVFVWGWAIEWAFFATEIAAAMVYYYGWDRLTPRQHLAVGWVYFASAWASLAVINGILAFMLTSGGWTASRSLADGFWNPTYFPMLAARTVVAVGLAGLYALYAAAYLQDRELKARVARLAVGRWIVPAAVLLPLTLGWTLSVASAAGAGVAETLGAPDDSLRALVRTVLFAVGVAGHPIVRVAARVALLAPVLLVLGALAVVWLRARTFTRLEAGALMLLGLASMGGAEWVREGLRKPWVIDRYMFVNGVRLPSAGLPPGVSDPFSLDALSARGVLATSPWARVPAGWAPGSAAFKALAPAARAALEAEAGQEAFALQCAACHTLNGHLGVARLVRGKSVAALMGVLEAAARPVGASGTAVAWSDPALRLDTWLGRRMPPFAGSEAEERAVAVYLARLGGNPEAGAEEAATADPGQRVFEDSCAACHGVDSSWPIGDRLKGRDEAALYDLIGRLSQVQPEMPAFEGSDGERRALAHYLAGISAAGRGR